MSSSDASSAPTTPWVRYAAMGAGYKQRMLGLGLEPINPEDVNRQLATTVAGELHSMAADDFKGMMAAAEKNAAVAMALLERIRLIADNDLKGN